MCACACHNIHTEVREQTTRGNQLSFHRVGPSTEMPFPSEPSCQPCRFLFCSLHVVLGCPELVVIPLSLLPGTMGFHYHYQLVLGFLMCLFWDDEVSQVAQAGLEFPTMKAPPVFLQHCLLPLLGPPISVPLSDRLLILQAPPTTGIYTCQAPPHICLSSVSFGSHRLLKMEKLDHFEFSESQGCRHGMQ